MHVTFRVCMHITFRVCMHLTFRVCMHLIFRVCMHVTFGNITVLLHRMMCLSREMFLLDLLGRCMGHRGYIHLIVP